MFEKFTNKKELNTDEPVYYESKEDSLENKIQEIQLENLDVSDLVKLEECQGIIDEIKNNSLRTIEQFEKEHEDFLERINDAYSIEDLENCALFCLLTNKEIPTDIETLDLEGEYSIETFLKDFLNNNNLN